LDGVVRRRRSGEYPTADRAVESLAKTPLQVNGSQNLDSTEGGHVLALAVEVQIKGK
jgi:hypothetical protein